MLFAGASTFGTAQWTLCSISCTSGPESMILYHYKVCSNVMKVTNINVSFIGTVTTSVSDGKRIHWDIEISFCIAIWLSPELGTRFVNETVSSRQVPL